MTGQYTGDSETQKKMPSHDRYREFVATVEGLKSRYPYVAPRTDDHEITDDTRLALHRDFRARVSRLTRDMATMSDGLARITACTWLRAAGIGQMCNSC